MTLLTFFVVIALGFCAFMAAPPASAQGGPGGPGGELPPIFITNITFSNDNPKEGETIVITVVIFNNGTHDISNVTVTLAYDTTNITIFKDITVPARTNVTKTVSWKAVKWDHSISAVPAVEGVPLTKYSMKVTISVKADPVGSVPPVAAALVVVLAMFAATVAVPAVWERVIKRNVR